MLCSKQIARLLLCGLCLLVAVATARPDSGGHVPLPGPGLAYGGIPYGSVSGNVAEYFKRQAPSIDGYSNLRVGYSDTSNSQSIDQW